MKLPKGWKTKAIGDIADVAGGIQKGRKNGAAVIVRRGPRRP